MARSVRANVYGFLCILPLVVLVSWVPLPFLPGAGCVAALAQGPEDVDYGLDAAPHRSDAEWVGENVSLLTGNVVETRQDVVFPSPHRMGLVFSAAYNSRSTAPGILGYGWSHSYGVVLTPPAAAGEPLKLVDATGRAHYFSEGDPGVFMGLYQERTLVRRLATGRYYWKCFDGTLYYFSDAGRLDWIRDAVGNIIRLRYTKGRLTSVIDEGSGRGLTFVYRTDGLLEAVKGPSTSAVQDGKWVNFGYDGNGNLTTVAYADGSGFAYEYADPLDPHNLTRRKNAIGHNLGEWSYDASDRCVGNTTRDDRSVAVEYVSATRAAVTDAYGVARLYTLATPGGRGHVVAVDLPNAPYARENAVRWVYDVKSRLIQVNLAPRLVDGAPVATVNRFRKFDMRGNPQTITLGVGEPGQRLINCTYHSDTSVLLSRSEPSVLGMGQKITVWDYDDPADPNDDPAVFNQKPTSLPRRLIEQGATRNPLGTDIRYSAVTSFTYNARGQVTSVDGPVEGADDTTTYAYSDDTSDLASITRPLEGTTTFSQYDAAGFPRRIFDVNNRARSLTYDGRGRLVAVAHLTDNETSRVTYNAAGFVASRTDEDGVSRTYTYDATYGRLSEITDSTGNRIALTYDARGNVIRREYLDASRNPAEVTRLDRWDYAGGAVPGLLHRTVQADDTFTEYTYEPSGRVASVKSPSGRVTAYAYDAFGNAVRVTDPAGSATNYGYDRYGNLIRAEDPDGRVTTRVLDDMSRLVEVNSPDTGVARYRYDLAGNLTNRTDAEGIAASYTYDALNRRTRASFGITPTLPAYTVNYAYDVGGDGKGRLTRVTTPTEVTNLDYDPRGRMISKASTVKWDENDPNQTVSFTVARTLSAGGRTQNLTYPSGRVETFVRTACACNVDSVTTTFSGGNSVLVSGFTYRPFGQASGMQLAGGGTVANEFDLMGRLTGSNPGTAFARTMTYDADGRLTGIASPGAPYRNLAAVYDPSGRLTQQTGAGGVTDFAYDGGGNREERTVTRSWGATVTTYAYTPGTNRLASETTGAAETLYTHDARGNVTGIGGKTLTYDQEGRLVRVSSGATALGSYGYNGFGERVRKTAGGVVTLYVYDFDGNCIAEAGSSGTTSAEYLYRGRVRIARVNPTAPGTIYSYGNGLTGAPEMLLDSGNVAVWEGGSKPFGAVLVRAVSSLTENFRYQGQYYDAETGYHYNHHRYYDPGTGRYLQPDPVGLAGGINPYLYAGNDPVNGVDPEGLQPPRPEGTPGFLPSGRDSSPLFSNKDAWIVTAEIGALPPAEPDPRTCCAEPPHFPGNRSPARFAPVDGLEPWPGIPPHCNESGAASGHPMAPPHVSVSN